MSATNVVNLLVVVGAPELSLVCDPNQLLNPAADGTDGVLKLHEALQHLRTASNCSCGSTVGVCDSSDPHGYTLSVAILKKILVDPRSSRTIEELISVFANALRNRFSRGQCQDDAWLVFSVDDGAVWTSTGPNIAEKLTPEFITSVSRDSQEYFSRNDHTGALLYIVNQYSQKLGVVPNLGRNVQIEDSWWERNVWNNVPETWSSSPWRWWILVFVLLILLLVLVGLVYTVYRLISMAYARARHHHDGYSVGRQHGAKH
uniref:TPM domain-containing protein n=1 Tax=Ditylenchus dipsaci TaxID=166011 RepID=A0A915CWE4_9BILA